MISGNAVRTVSPSAGWVVRSFAPTSATAVPPPLDAPIMSYRVCKNFGLIGFDCVTPDRIHRRSESDRLTVNGKHRFVTGISRKFFHMLVVISERHRKAIHLNAEPLFEQFLATDDFVLDPFFIVGARSVSFWFVCRRAQSP